jgi:hypothetical protein
MGAFFCRPVPLSPSGLQTRSRTVADRVASAGSKLENVALHEPAFAEGVSIDLEGRGERPTTPPPRKPGGARRHPGSRASSRTIVTGRGRRFGRFLPHFSTYQGFACRIISSCPSRGHFAERAARGSAVPEQSGRSASARGSPWREVGSRHRERVLQCASMGAFLGRRRATGNDSINFDFQKDESYLRKDALI